MGAVVPAAPRVRLALRATFGLAFMYVAVEVVGGLATDGADAARLLTDAGGLALALLVARTSAKPASPRPPDGTYRFEILAAVSMAAVRLFLAFFILYEAYARFRAPPEVAIPSMLVVAAAGLVGSPIGTRLFRVACGDSLNMRPTALALVVEHEAPRTAERLPHISGSEPVG